MTKRDGMSKVVLSRRDLTALVSLTYAEVFGDVRGDTSEVVGRLREMRDDIVVKHGITFEDRLMLSEEFRS